MFTGRDALFSIERAIGRVRRDEGRLDAALRSAVDEAARLRRAEADAFRALARVRLDAIARDQVVEELDTTEERALAMIEEYRRDVDTLARRLEEAQAALDKAEDLSHERDQSLADALEALDELRHSTEEAVTSDPAWKEAEAALKAAEQVAANADRKASDGEADLAEKRKPYEDDPLFMYLWNKKHGGAEDSSGFLVRFFDRKVARLVGFHEARTNYTMLQEIPARLREHAINKHNDVEAARKRLADIERQALVGRGIEAVEERVAKAQAEAKSAGEEVQKIIDELQQIETERQNRLDPGENVVVDKAVDLLADALSRENLRQLYRDAARTATQADDRALSAISAARRDLRRADDEVAQIRTEIREMARRRSELEGARDRARRRGYDDPRGTLGGGGGDVIGNVIGGILGGVLAGGALDDLFERDYRFPRRRSRGGFGGPWGPPPGPGPWGGGGGGGGGGGDGGWRTGGSF